MAAAIGNQYALGHGCGRPRKYESAAELYSIGSKYIEETLAAEKHLTFTGLCLAMGMIKNTFYDYESGKYDTDKEVFSNPLKELKLRVENYAESRLFGNNPTGAIFALKNYGWKDVQTVENVPPADLLNKPIIALADSDLKQLLEIMERNQIQGEIVDIKKEED